MKLKQLFLGSLIFLFTVSTIGVLCPIADLASPSQLDDHKRSQVLAATVQIVMYMHAAEDAESEDGSQGLGTLVTAREQSFLVTHDHWSSLTPNLKEVEFRNAQGDFLLLLDAETFKELIRYRDGGTMILRAPDNLQGIVPAEMAAGSGITGDDRLWRARYSPAQHGISLEVAPVLVEAVEQDVNPPRLQLRLPDGKAAIPGDSGGGVWHNGQFVGNVWANAVKLRRSNWGAQSGAPGETPLVVLIAALYPTNRESQYAQNNLVHPAAERRHRLLRVARWCGLFTPSCREGRGAVPLEHNPARPDPGGAEPQR